MKSNTLITEELNRIKEIMGLKIINEAISSGTLDVLKKLFGVSDEVAQKLETNTESILKNVVGGTGSYDDIADYVARQTGGVKSVDNVVDWIRTQPAIIDQLVKSNDTILRNAAEQIFRTLNLQSILTPDSYDDIVALMQLPITKNNKDTVIKFIDDAITTLNQKKGSNPNIDDLIKELEGRKKIAQSYDQQTNLPPLTQPTPISQFDSAKEIKSLLDDVAKDPNFQNKYPNVNLSQMLDEVDKLSRYYSVNIKTFQDLMQFRTKLTDDLEGYIAKLQKTADDAAARGDLDTEKIARKNLEKAEKNKTFIKKAWNYCYTQKGVKGGIHFVGCTIGLIYAGFFILGTIYGYKKQGGLDLHDSQKFCPVMVSALPIFGCDTEFIQDMCPKMCGGGESSSEESSGEEGGGALGPDDY